MATDIINLEGLLVNLTKEMLNSETMQLRALKILKNQANSFQLRKLIGWHIAETEMQIDRLYQVANELKVTVTNEHCPVMKSLIKNLFTMLDRCEQIEISDTVIALGLQKIKHQEATSYGSMVAFANQLNLFNPKNLLQATLEEEKRFDLSLSILSVEILNPNAQLKHQNMYDLIKG